MIQTQTCHNVILKEQFIQKSKFADNLLIHPQAIQIVD